MSVLWTFPGPGCGFENKGGLFYVCRPFPALVRVRKQGGVLRSTLKAIYYKMPCLAMSPCGPALAAEASTSLPVVGPPLRRVCRKEEIMLSSSDSTGHSFWSASIADCSAPLIRRWMARHASARSSARLSLTELVDVPCRARVKSTFHTYCELPAARRRLHTDCARQRET